MNTELPRNRLATTDETGRRVYLYPTKVKGIYASRKLVVHSIMLVLFLVLPWIEVGGRQLVLLDVARREFYLFGLHFRAHDAPLILLVLLAFAFLLGFVTAVWGRVWCGWACPQTVFTEFLFRRIERWVEGNHLARRDLDLARWDAKKILRKTAKWSLFTLVALAITHSFLAYFVGSRELIAMIQRPPAENWPSFLVIAFTTAVILFDFGWFREQFCVILCPYGRFQSVMLDAGSTVVGYDVARGEPRRGTAAPGEKTGDCVSCSKCVTACPTGIDIRRGLQMECIACTACIDACDSVMEKVGKPRGLIRYTSLAELAGKTRRRLSPRSIIYALLTTSILVALAVTLGRKDFLEATILRAKGAPYELLGETEAWNHFRLDLSNQTGHSETVALSLPPPAGTTLVMPQNPVTLPDGATQKIDFFIRFPRKLLEHGQLKRTLELKTGEGVRTLEVTLVGPDA